MEKTDLSEVLATLRETDFPTLVIVELTAFCNLRCTICPSPTLKRQRGIMSFGLFQKIVDEIVEKNSETQLWVAIMGESMLLGDKLYRYICYAKDAGIKNVILNTNGMLLSPEVGKKLHEAGLDEIIIGIDGITIETYSKIRVGGDLNKVTRNVETILKQVQRERWNNPKIVVQFIVMNENANEVELFKQYWLECGAIVKVRRKLGWGTGIMSENLDIPPASPLRIPCPWLMRTISIHWNGNVAQCDGDYEGEYSPGNINKQSIEEIWLGELKKRRTRHWARDFDFMPCRECKDWQCGLSEWHYPRRDRYGNREKI